MVSFSNRWHLFTSRNFLFLVQEVEIVCAILSSWQLFCFQLLFKTFVKYLSSYLLPILYHEIFTTIVMKDFYLCRLLSQMLYIWLMLFKGERCLWKPVSLHLNLATSQKLFTIANGIVRSLIDFVCFCILCIPCGSLWIILLFCRRCIFNLASSCTMLWIPKWASLTRIPWCNKWWWSRQFVTIGV